MKCGKTIVIVLLAATFFATFFMSSLLSSTAITAVLTSLLPMVDKVLGDPNQKDYEWQIVYLQSTI